MIPEVHKIKESVKIKIYDPQDNYLGTISDELSFVDFRQQIVDLQIEGYYFIRVGDEDKTKNHIQLNGRIEYPNQYPFNKQIQMLSKLITTGSKNV